MRKTVFITGSSSGIGLATAQAFLTQGYTVFASMRHSSSSTELLEFAEKNNHAEQLQVIELDVTSDTSVEKALKQVRKITQSLDVLINNAGFGYVGMLADMRLKELEDQLNTNLFGIHRVITALLPLTQAAHGAIINVSSISGQITFPLSGAYCASKHALEAYTESLWMELKPLGIRVYLIEPGAINTSFYSKGTKRVTQTKYLALYQKRFSGSIINSEGRTRRRSNPNQVAEKMVMIAREHPRKLRHYVGRYSFLFPFLHKVLPTELFYWGLQKAMG